MRASPPNHKSRVIRILIVTPAREGSTKGNRITAQRWAHIIQSLGHQVQVAEEFTGGGFDVLIALHARKSAESIAKFRESFLSRPIIVALTGTDLNCDLGRSRLVDRSLQLADRIVHLEPKGVDRLDPEIRRKSRVIFQSSQPSTSPPAKLTRFFEVSVVGHLRPVKDPFRAALAARRLSASSRVRVVHLGGALTINMERQALQEMSRNPRYRWLGPVPHRECQRRLARSRITVLSSESEGGSVVIAEAIVNNVPILASRIDANIGMLESNYPGYFDYQDTQSLADLISKAETSQAFYQMLLSAGQALRSRFLPAAEQEAWKDLLQAFSDDITT